MTPAIDLAVKHKIYHKVHTYTHDRAAASYGLEAAQAMNIDPERVFKTLVVELNNGQLAVAVVPVAGTLNLKLFAKAMKMKKAIMAETNRVQRSTGYVVGGVSPLAQRTSLATIIDESAKSHVTVFVSAGKRGLEIELAALDLASLCDGEFAIIANL